MVVDLPAPFGPRKPCTSPSATVRSSPSSARTEPKFFVSPWISIAASDVSVLGVLSSLVLLGTW